MKRVVLVRTQGPRNAGLALRAAANFGPAELWLAAPQDVHLVDHPEFHEMAHGVPPAARRVPLVETLSAALADCTWAVGFTARAREQREIRPLEEVRARLLAMERDGGKVALVFGSEADGLDDAEAARVQELVRIPTSPVHPSINLGAAVSIVLCALFPGPEPAPVSAKHRPLPAAERVRLQEHLARALAPWLRGDAARAALLRSIERVFARASLETRDAQAWHKLLRELESALPPTASDPPERERRDPGAR